MWLLLLNACWRPDPDLAPELPPLEAAPDLTVADGAPVDAEPAAPEEDDPPAEPTFVGYPAYTAGAPVTLVDDYGKTLCIVASVGSPVEVRAEDENVRKKVWSEVCIPAVEGWAQSQMITGRGEPPPPAPSEALPGLVPVGATGGPELGPAGR